MKSTKESTSGSGSAGSSSSSSSDFLKPGTTLLTCEPFVYASYINISRPVWPCDTCFAVKEGVQLQRCASCRFVRYCDRTCQEKGWKDGHKYECKDGLGRLLKTYESVPNLEREKQVWNARILLRLILKLQDGDHFHDEFDIEGKVVKCRFGDLLSHMERIKADKEWQQSAMRTIQIPGHLLGPNSPIKVPSATDLIEMLAKVTFNSFDIGNGYYTFGRGVYLAKPILKHSCNPNAVRVFDGPTMHVRNIAEISKSMPFDEVTTTYTNLLIPSENRRNDLMKNYNFQCDCERCKSGELDKDKWGIKCSNNGCNAMISTKEMNHPCTACGHMMRLEEVALVKATETAAVRMLIYVGNLDLPRIEACIQQMKSVHFSDSHWVMLKLFQTAYDEAKTKDSEGKSKDIGKAYEYGSKYLLGLRRYRPSLDQRLMWHLFEMSYVAISLSKLDEAERYLAEAKSIGEVLRGKNSVFIGDLVKEVEEKITAFKKTTEAEIIQLGLDSLQA